VAVATLAATGPWGARPAAASPPPAPADWVGVTHTHLDPNTSTPPAPWGTLLVNGADWAGGWASRGDLNVYSNGDGNHDRHVASGDAYECVELAQRWATLRYQSPPIWQVNADGMWARGPQLPIPFRQLPNGGGVAPQFGDLVVWGPGAASRFGHVAIVAGTGPGYVDVVEQNWNNHPGGGRTRLTITGTTMDARDGLPVDGWLRSSLEIDGYWLLGGDGGIFPFGTSGGFGSTGNLRLNRPIVSMAPTPSGRGYWLVAADGGVFPFGDAAGYGSAAHLRLRQPVVGMAATPTGHGYWLVAADGGIFPFGDAPGYGSAGNLRLSQPIVGMAAVPGGGGYWLVAGDGGIFPFGPAAGGYGSTGKVRLNRPIVGMAASASGHGYWLVASDGGIFPFGDAPGMGSTGGRALPAPIVGIATTRDGGGYWLAGAQGATYPFGDAEPIGSVAGLRINAPMIGLVAMPASAPAG
jgi:hypothetical protein